jgi:hypothetical protein
VMIGAVTATNLWISRSFCKGGNSNGERSAGK